MSELLRIEGLTKRFEGIIANENIDFSVERGTVRCIIGPNGAGKTTLISLVSGHLKPTHGSIRFEGQDITHEPVVTRARLGIVRKFQKPTVFQNLSVFENLELAALATRRSAQERIRRIREVLELVRLSEESQRRASVLSHGQTQWLEIGLLLANDGKLLLLDEPTAGMTAEETHSTSELVRSLVRELNLSIVIIEHDINFIRDLQAPVTVLHLGHVVVEGSFADVERNEEVRNIYLGKQ